MTSFWAFLTTYLPPYVDIVYVINFGKKVDIFELSAYPLLLVNVVCKRPLSEYERQNHLKSLQLVAWKINLGIFSGVREVDDTVRELRKENFNLKLRIYFLEERLGKFVVDYCNVSIRIFKGH